jgi:D-serine deaminase-like pyridoxal phosphate-dependent protein
MLTKKADRLGLTCRPHFKTHQSAAIGKWFAEEGVSGITVSSPEMAHYFASHGWTDITIAFPFFRPQTDIINQINPACMLRLFVHSADDITYIGGHINRPISVMIEIDAGYNRSGVAIDDRDRIKHLVETAEETPDITFKGFYIHDGGTYHVSGKEAVQSVIDRDLNAFQTLKSEYPSAEYGIGDTPSCSLLDDFSPATELSPGNLIFYDLMQIQIGSCAFNDLGLLVKVPVAQEKQETDQCIIHGGAVHFSKERLKIDGHEVYGQPVVVDSNGDIKKIDGAYLSALSQEHGTVNGLQSIKKAYQTDALQEMWICPVHSCLTANLFEIFQHQNGDVIEKRILS